MFRRRRATFRPLVDLLDERCLLSGLTPAQIKTAYGLPTSLSAGSGKTIAIVDAYNDPNIKTELATYDAQYGLPGTTATTVSNYLTVVNQSGQTSLPSTNSGWAEEIALDVEEAHALAPGAKIVLVEANSASLSDLMTAAQTAVTTEGANVVSMSFGQTDSSLRASQVSAYDAFFASHTSVTFVASSGDSGGSNMPGGGAEYPSSSPSVLAVGGTTLNLSSTGAYVSESNWIDSGGGISAFEPEPTNQRSVQSTGRRETPDVSFDGNPNTGVSVYSTYAGGWATFGGTSVGAPSWAAIVADIDQLAGKSLGTATIQNDLYSLHASTPTDFNPITVTTTTITTGPRGFPTVKTTTTTGTAYNTSTGLGTINASGFNALVSAAAGTTTSHVITAVVSTPTSTTTTRPSTTITTTGGTTTTAGDTSSGGENGQTTPGPVPWSSGYSGFYGSKTTWYRLLKSTSNS